MDENAGLAKIHRKGDAAMLRTYASLLAPNKQE